MKIGENACEMLTLKIADYEHAMNKLNVFEWNSWFKERQKDMHNSIRSGQTKKTKRSKCLYGNSERVMRNLFKRRESKWILYHVNTSAHVALGVCEFLAKKFIPKMRVLPYSPNFAPWDY